MAHRDTLAEVSESTRLRDSDDEGHPTPCGRDILLFPNVFSPWHATCTVIRERAIDQGEIIP
ncbi:hypothetical protein IE4872_PC00253 (plasmid) [Rhizobium gallicum]|uniref:Uncharacterized protein n=1 Tax=Rhizobium gallicum TaxID=56730 RepID=A0A1L5NQU6_9HYPH|nr:hypothetical protein IE4872_PC00253 [Rhizobium gallicum]